MADNFLVNDQIVDSVAGVATLATGQAPSNAFGMLDTVMVETMAMAMYNAVSRQQNAGMTTNAAVTAACAKMLAVPMPMPSPPPPPATPAPQVAPLAGPTPPSNMAAAEAAAMAQAQAGIAWLRQLAQQSGSDAATANAALAELVQLATGPAPPSPASSSSPPPSSSSDPAGSYSTYAPYSYSGDD
jgi:hypothetical protein